GRSSGSARFYGLKSASWTTGRTYYRKQTVWVCNECYPKFAATQFKQTLAGGAVWLGLIVGGIWLFSDHGPQVSNQRADEDTAASITKQDPLQPIAPSAGFALVPRNTGNNAQPTPSQLKYLPVANLKIAPIQEAQNILTKLGYDVGPSDGKIGPRTLSAL